ncbi:DUF488 family protein [Halomarina halobia]|uniref:DUF488 family protein n=1 Tax=Halomarina halobia TaxID=3033386 RepID=A0ABD6A4Q5_9EURY|nr:DUF488 family protein [Halomarina sp. PSR21]
MSGSDAGTLAETYLAAVQHDLVDLSGEETLVGVVRRPTRWFSGAVDENRPELGPPGELLDEVKARHEDLKARGLCDEGAHNAAWEDVDFERRYREHLAESENARAAIEDLAERVGSGEDVVLVCFEGEKKACHRHALREIVAREV